MDETAPPWIVLVAMAHLLLLQVVSVSGQRSPQSEPRAPEFLPGKQTVSVFQNGLAILPCAVRYLGDRQVAWRRLDTEHFLTIGRTTWVKDSNILIEHSQGPGGLTHWNLMIRGARPDQSGVYECQVTSSHKAAINVTLRVLGVEVWGTTQVMLGGRIHLKCNATDDPAPLWLDWYRNGVPLSSGVTDNVIITRFRSENKGYLFSDLIIDNSRASDQGEYLCHAGNGTNTNLVNSTVVHVHTVKSGSMRHQPSADQAMGSGTVKRFSDESVLSADDPEKPTSGGHPLSELQMLHVVASLVLSLLILRSLH